MTKYPELWVALAAPIPGEKSRQQAGRTFKYITARQVMNRLDDVLGPENWRDEYTIAGEHSVIWRLTIRLPDGQELTKVDAGGAAGMSDAGDDEKSGFSDAFKRAAVKFGVGRYLYGDGLPAFAKAQAKQPAPPAKPVTRGKPVAPTTGPELLECIRGVNNEPDLEAWVVRTFSARGYPVTIAEWSGPIVSQALPEIRDHMARTKITREMTGQPVGNGRTQ